jgi:monoamine oxidase
MDRLPAELARRLATPVELGMRLLSVEEEGAAVTLRCAGGASYRCAYAVIAIPMAALQRVTFTPPLPAVLADAIDATQMSGNTQFVLYADRAYWEDDGLPSSLWTDTIFERVFAEFEGEELDHLRVWINGDNAGRVDALGPAAESELLRTLGRIRPSMKGHLRVGHRISWGADPLIGGEKYVLGPGDVGRFARALAQPVGRLHWAGEHHKSKEVGIEAALQAGERAARELIARARPGAAAAT